MSKPRDVSTHLKGAAVFCAVMPWALWVSSCAPNATPIPTDSPKFPTGIAVTDDGKHLVVVSSNYNLAYASGAVLSASLDRVFDKIDVDDAPAVDEAPVVKGAYTSAVYVPAFGDVPVLFSASDSDGNLHTRMWLPLKGANSLTSIDVSKSGKLSCSSDGDVPTCANDERTVTFADADPFDVVPLTTTVVDGRVQEATGLVTLLSSKSAYLVREDVSADSRLKVIGSIKMGDTVGGVRAALLRPASNNSVEHVFTAMELDTQEGYSGAVIGAFAPVDGADVRGFDVTSAMGALQLRDMVLVPGTGDTPDALVVVTRNPESLARFDIDDSAGEPHLELSAVVPVCHTPIRLAAVPSSPHLLLTCQDGDVIQMLDARTLAVTDALRFVGRGPYNLALDGTRPVAYVSFFLDDSIGVVGLTKDGRAGLRFLGRVGVATDKPEDGRE